MFDLLIIGGGIIGCATARDAAMRGLKVLLVEKEDFGSGASSKTSKLAHGGLRYLETLDFELVQESLRERDLLLKNAPGFVSPLRFFFPIFKKNRWLVKLGLTIYDFFSKSLPKHRSVSSAMYPFLKDVKGGFHYYDGTMKDSRLLIENMLSAREHGATLLNYTEVTEFLEGKVHIKSTKRGIDEIVPVKHIVNATGSLADTVRNQAGEYGETVTQSKGIHIVLKQQISEDAVLLLSPIDGRVFFLIPWEEMTLLGTTDTEISSPLSKDIDYLLHSANAYLKKPLTRDDIASTFAGVRPLVRSGKHTYKASRSVKISTSNITTVIGGKYTTYRSIAEAVVDTFTKTPCKTADAPFTTPPETHGLIASGLYVPLVERLEKTWITRTPLCLEYAVKYPKLLCPHHPYTEGELIYTLLHEDVFTAEDWQYRRTTSAYTGTCTDQCREHINDIIERTLCQQSTPNL